MDVSRTHARDRMHTVLWEIEEKGIVSPVTVDEFFSGSPHSARNYLEVLEEKALLEKLVAIPPRYRLSPRGKSVLRGIDELAAEECKRCTVIRQCITNAFLEVGLNVEPVVVDIIVASRNPPKAFGKVLKKHTESGGGSVVTLDTAEA